MGKVEKTRFERNWTTFVNPAFCPAWKSPLKMVVWNRPRGIRFLGCFFRFAPMGKVEKTRFERNWTTFVNPAFCPAWKSPLKMVVWNRPRGFDPKGVFSFRPDGESRKNAFWTQLDDVRQPGFLPCLEKPTRNGGMKPTSWNSIPRVFFSFRPDGESRKNAFWTQLDDVRQPGFLPCLEKPTQNDGMKPTSWNSIPRVFFCFAPMGKVEKTRFERNWTTFVNPAFCPAWKSPLKMVVWNRPSGIRSQGCFFVSPRWGKSKKRVLNAIGRRSSTRLFALLGKAHSKWWYETDLVEFDPKGVFFRFAPMGKVEKTRFERNWTTFVNPAFCPAWKSPLKMMVWNRPRGIRSLGCFFRFAPMGKVEKTRFERNWTTFVNPAFCPAWKSPLKMVVWNRPSGNRSQGCFFVSPRWGKSKKRVLNAIGRRLSTRLFALLGKAHSKWWYETNLVEFDPKGVFSFRPDGESRKKRVLNAIGRRLSTRLFALLGKAHSKWWYETDLVEFDPKGVFSFRPVGESRKNAFWTQLDDVCQPGFLPCLQKPTQNGGMKPT